MAQGCRWLVLRGAEHRADDGDGRHRAPYVRRVVDVRTAPVIAVSRRSRSIEPFGSAAVVVWAAVVVGALVAGRAVVAAGVGLGAAPLVGRWDVHVAPGLLVATVIGVAVVAAGPILAARLTWRWVPLSVAFGSIAWSVALASSDGWDRLTTPLTTRYEYEPFAATIESAAEFVRGFVEAVPSLPTHVKAHPPAATLVPWLLDRIGLGGAGWFAAVVIVCWGVAGAAAVVAARAVVGEAAARRAAPVLALLPAAVWAATSADAMFAGVVAVGIAVAVVRPGGLWWAGAGGAVLGVALLLSYGAVLSLMIPLAVALHRRRPGDVIATGAGVALVLLLAAAAGFWWLDGLRATRDVYWDGVAGRRPLAYLALLGNPAALALAVGPAVIAGLWRRRSVLVVAGAAAVFFADVSLLSAGEVERIWLPFVPWLALAGPGLDRRWLAAQAAVGITLQAALRSPW
jgi:methylthioxylose transferase